jgi:hypothetical protein
MWQRVVGSKLGLLLHVVAVTCYIVHVSVTLTLRTTNPDNHRLIFDTKWHSRILLLTTLLTDSILHIRLGEVRSNNSLVTSF